MFLRLRWVVPVRNHSSPRADFRSKNLLLCVSSQIIVFTVDINKWEFARMPVCVIEL